MLDEQYVFLDIDGVLNGHEKFENNYSGLKYECVEIFNDILKKYPNMKLIIHSSWRYMIHTGSMNLEGMQNLFLTHGLLCYKRLHGITESDEITATYLGRPHTDFSSVDAWQTWVHTHGAVIRKAQIERYAQAYKIRKYVVVDDIELNMSQQIKTIPNEGFNYVSARRLSIALEENNA